MAAETKTKGQLERALMETEHELRMKTERVNFLEEAVAGARREAEAAKSFPQVEAMLLLLERTAKERHGVELKEVGAYIRIHARQVDAGQDRLVQELSRLLELMYKTPEERRVGYPVYSPFEGWMGPRRG